MENNCKIIKVLNELKDINTFLGNRFKARAYQQAAYVLGTLDGPITSSKDVSHLRGIGKGISYKIDRILEGKEIEELHDYQDDPKIKAYLELDKVHDISKATIKKLIDQGITNIDELKYAVNKGIVKLTTNQMIGLWYYYDFQKKIPRKEIQKFETKMKNLFKNYKDILGLQVVGSYRRKVKQSSDIDLLVCIKGNSKKISIKLLHDILSVLMKKGIIIESFTDPVKVTTKYMGVIHLGNSKIGRRLDIRVVTERECPYALLYFTGSKAHNINMRAIAKRHGYSLNEYALTKLVDGKKIYLKTEADIYKKLKLNYLKPEER